MRAYYDGLAREDFNKARSKAFFHRVLNIISPDQEDLLSLDEVRKLVPAKGESYQGLKTVPIRLIVGSEGRYQDFNKKFLPKKEHLRVRWTSIDRAHHSDIILPPVQLYEVGGVYFVRDGNHRVSVAKMQGVEAVDAEVTVLDSDIAITPEMTRNDLKRAVIEFEYQQFCKHTQFDKIIPDYTLLFTATGRYDEVLNHIYEHKYYMNLHHDSEIPFEDAMKSWFTTVYQPIVEQVEEEGLLARFPDRTEADLYVWIVKHWHYLKEKYGPGVSAKAAALDYSQQFGKNLRERIKRFFARFIQK
jgi:hypothetical protein